MKRVAILTPVKAFSYIIIVLLQMPIGAKAGNFDTIIERYNQSYLRIDALIKANGSFKKAVYIAESTFLPLITEQRYYDYIDGIAALARLGIVRYQPLHYNYSDSNNYLLNRSILAALRDTIEIKSGLSETISHPAAFNFNDPNGKKDWTNVFVTKLLTNLKGNCRSLTYLYKIISDETGSKCWMALAPGHIYIRNYSQKIGWYNTELTSGTFPTDAWIAASGYVSTDAIRSGIYMDTLSNQQSIALCILDLAKGYEIQTHNYYDGFILKCCELVLQYHPVNPMALLQKAETLKKVYFIQAEEKSEDAASTYVAMENTYLTLAKLHYREMPEKMYNEWLLSISKQKAKYTNKKITSSVNKKKEN